MKALRPYQQQAVNECWDALKASDEPVLLMASVGAGKSLMLGSILLTMQKANKNALCLINNAELVRNNCETFREQGGMASIFCAALGIKDISQSIIFATPQTILNAINKNHPIADIKFNMIMIDEAHAINYLNHRSSFMRVLRHYKQQYKDMRVLGATGTNFRFKGSEIVGDKCLFKTQVGNITTERLIEEGYLIEPTFSIDENLVLDFSKVKVKQNGLFDQKQLDLVISQSTRLTELICKQIVHVMTEQKRFGIFIFATSKKHAFEILSHLPPDESAIILGETSQDEREKILNAARVGTIRYLVNIAIISVGVDVPAFDSIAYLRPTESLVLLVQTLGRALRLSKGTGKSDALVLDFAGNLERHRDWDSPLLLKAVTQTLDRDKPCVIRCPRAGCETYNTEHARRCVGTKDNVRCDYYFEFKPCPNATCGVQNDIAARLCRACDEEIIDPNAKLSLDHLKAPTIEVDVLKAHYSISGPERGFQVKGLYACRSKEGNEAIFGEYYTMRSDKAMRVFYGQFVRPHVPNASKWYIHLHKRHMVEEMLSTNDLLIPTKLVLANEDGKVRIKKKIFREGV
jgi:DNA repair protein RadD